MTLHEHAQRIAGHELANRRLSALPAAQRRAVEELARSLATALADGLVEAAAAEPPLAGALASIYGSELVPHARLVRQPLELGI